MLGQLYPGGGGQRQFHPNQPQQVQEEVPSWSVDWNMDCSIYGIMDWSIDCNIDSGVLNGVLTGKYFLECW